MFHIKIDHFESSCEDEFTQEIYKPLNPVLNLQLRKNNYNVGKS